MNLSKILLLLLGFSLCLISCKKGETTAAVEEEEEETATGDTITLTKEQMDVIEIKIGSISERQMDGALQVTGTLRLSPQNRAEVSSLITGMATKILVKEGDNVSAGQTVALVENTDIVTLQKDYLIASSQVDITTKAYERQQNIRSQGAGVEKNLQQAKAELDMALSTEQGLRRQLEQLGISTQSVANGQFTNTIPVKAPISGTVGEVLVSTGSHIDNTTVLMNIYNNSALHADLNVFESDISNIRIGQSVDLQLSDKNAPIFRGKVSFITETVDSNTKSASVHVKLDDKPQSTLLPNMFVSASIHCENRICDAVPEEAIVSSGGRNYVFVSLGEGKFVRTEVATGPTQLGYTQITFVDNQNRNRKIVTSKAFYLQSMLADHGEEE